MGSDHDCIQRAHIGQEACNQTARLLGAQLQVSAFLAQIVKLYLQELNLHPDSNGGMRRSKCIHMSCRSTQNYVTHGQACRRSQKVLPSWGIQCYRSDACRLQSKTLCARWWLQRLGRTI